MTEHVELRLVGAHSATGQIDLGDLAHLAEALHQLTIRIGRDLAGRSGPGRTTSGVESSSQLSLVGVAAGSTRLLLVSDASDRLEIEDPFSTQSFDRFWEVIAGLAEGRRPEWVTVGVSDAAIRLTRALGSAAEECEFSGRRDRQARRPVRFRTGTVNREPWHSSPEHSPGEARTVSGALDLVDLRTRRFRVRDDLGHDIGLYDVDDSLRVAEWIGRRVTATGPAETGVRGRVLHIIQPHVELASATALWTSDPSSLAAAFDDRGGPDPRGVKGVDEEEVDRFLTALRA